MAKSSKIVAAFVTNQPDFIPAMFTEEILKRIQHYCHILPVVITLENIYTLESPYKQIEILFSTWGMFSFQPAHFEQLPNLKALFYAAGSVKDFADPFLERGIKISCARQANAIPVANFTLAHILLACKGYFRNVNSLSHPTQPKTWKKDAPMGPGIFNQRISLIGNGAVVNELCTKLAPFHLNHQIIKDYPSLKKETIILAAKSSLVLSNHLPNRPEFQHIFDEQVFQEMPYGATFINTGRGHQIDEEGLIKVLSERDDLTAILDVTHPEPPPLTSPLRSLPNVELSSHLSGSINLETQLLTQCVVAEFDRWVNHKPLLHEITEEEMAIIA